MPLPLPTWEHAASIPWKDLAAAPQPGALLFRCGNSRYNSAVQTETATRGLLAWHSSDGAGPGLLVGLRDRRLILVVMLALLAGLLAYQAPPSSGVAIGWPGDRLFLNSSEGPAAPESDRFYGDELTDTARSGRSRWTRQNATIRLPGLGTGGELALTLRVQGWPDDALNTHTRQPTVSVLADGMPVGHFTPTADWADYQFTIPGAARTSDLLVLTLQASDTFTSTRTYADARPKGIRLEHVGVQGIGEQLVPPAPLPLTLLAIDGVLGLLALGLLTRRPDLAFVLAIVLVSAGAMGLALVRVWTAALLPWLTLGLGLLLLAARRVAIADLAVQLLQRYARGAALNYGLTVMAAAWLAYAVARASSALHLPGLRAVRESFPDSLLYGLLGMGLALLVLVRGRDGLPRLCHAFVRLVGARHSAPALLGVFAAIWIGYEAAFIASVPYVGHADYADNAVVARNLVAGRGWVVDYVTQFYRLYDGVTRPQETWPLLQPVWIAPFFLLFGASAWAAKIPNLIFTALLVALIYAAGTQLWDRRVGLVAAILALTSHLFFKLAIYVTSDLAFTVLSFGAVYLLFLATDDRRQMADGRPQAAGGRRQTGEYRLQTADWKLQIGDTATRSERGFRFPGFPVAAMVGSAVLTGLMMLQKPSGVLIAGGMGVWVLRWWALGSKGSNTPARSRIGQYAARILPIALWGLIAFAILAPYLARNMLLFGVPFYSTESHDAWVQGYGEDWEIYKVYTTEAGLSETNGLPDRSWVLRWGFDRTMQKLANQAKAVRTYLLPPWTDQPLDLRDPGTDNRGLLFSMGTWLGLLGVLGALRTRRRLLGLLLAAFGPYMAFLIVYWHADEERYFVMLLPWLALLASYALWRGYDRIAAIGDGRWTPIGLALVGAALVGTIQPSWPIIAEKVQLEPQRWAADIDAYSWLREHTSPGAVIMTRNPWQLNWHSQRPALMIPHTSNPETLLRLARFYNVRYLVIDSSQRPGSADVRRMLERLTTDPAFGMQQVYATPIYQARDTKGRPITMQTTIFRFPDSYGGVAELRP